MKSHQWTWYVLWMTVFMIIWFVAFGHAEDWRSKYTDTNGVNCCGKLDCIKAEVTLLTEPTQDPVRILVSFVQPPNAVEPLWRNVILDVPMRSVHRSEDAYGYWCHRMGPSAFGPFYSPYQSHSGERCSAPDYLVNEKCLRCIFVSWGS